MAQEIQIEIPDLPRFIEAMRTWPATAALEMNRAVETTLWQIEADAKRGAPVDTGRLRSSITHQVRWMPGLVEGVVGTNVSYAPYMEFGTGRVGDPAVPHSGKHWPPAAALDVWARRHGFGPDGGKTVAWIIGRRGGLRPRRFLRNAIDKNQTRIQRNLEAGLNRLLQKMSLWRS